MKKIKTFITIIAVSLPFLFSSCITIFAKDIKGDGKLVTQSISISDFSKVKIETYTEINYSQEKNSGKLEFTVDGNLWEYYNIYTKGDVLYIKLKEKFRHKINLKPTKSLITISSTQLEEIGMAGSSRFNFCTDFTSSKLSMDMAGSGKIFANKHSVTIEECSIGIAGSGNVFLTGNIQEAEIDIAGSGKVHLAGTIKEAEIDIAGSGNVSALNCEIKNLSVELAGSGSVEAQVTDKLDVEIAGSGNVKYKGNPTVSTDIAGSGKVKKI